MAIKLLDTCSTCEVHKLSFFTLETFQVVLHPFNGSSIYFMFNILYVTYVQLLLVVVQTFAPTTFFIEVHVQYFGTLEITNYLVTN